MSSSIRSRVNTYSSLVLERHGESRDDAALAAARLGSKARFLLLHADGRALVDEAGSCLRALVHTDCAALPASLSPVYLGENEHHWFLLRADAEPAERIANETGGRFMDLRSAGLSLPPFDAGLFAYARALANWQERLRYCHLCGAPVELVSAGHRAKCTNPQCGSEHFPRTDPAIIVLVERDGACLLGRQKAWPPKRYSTLAGFVEPGETLEDAVRREVFEEAGVRVGECDYHSSQPWPFPASIMLGFIADTADATIRLGPELEDARWFTPAEIVAGIDSGELLMPMPVSISYRLVEHWLRRTAGLELGELTQGDPVFRRPR
ncbi:MAG TPA: NAD(+) diphosphatase [Rudaea sp.]|nr:NAD(+) diphosphatase [Rudaea sp.]